MSREKYFERRQKVVSADKLKKPKRLKKIIRAYAKRNMIVTADYVKAVKAKESYKNLLKYIVRNMATEGITVDVGEMAKIKEMELMIFPVNQTYNDIFVNGEKIEKVRLAVYTKQSAEKAPDEWATERSPATGGGFAERNAESGPPEAKY